jgi:uncharacterized RDD family membrane protein YckC
LLAVIVDSLVLSASGYAGGLIGTVLTSAAREPGEVATLAKVSVVIALAFTAAVLGVNLWLVHEHGQSIAKRWLRLRVVRKDGSRAHVVRIVLLRNGVPLVITMVPLLGALFWLVDALFIFRRDRRCLHDHIADTIVIRVPRSERRG